MAKFCESCGAKLREIAAFCPQCGIAVRSLQSEAMPSVEPQRRIPAMAVAVGVLITGGALAAVAFMPSFSPKMDMPPASASETPAFEVEPSDRQPSTPASQARSVPAGLLGCSAVREDGVITNVGDLFQCSKGDAIKMLSEGSRMEFTADDVGFSQGRYTASMKQPSQAAFDENARQMEICRREGRMICEDEFVPEFKSFCSSSSNILVSGQKIIVFARMENYQGSFAMFNCE